MLTQALFSGGNPRHTTLTGVELMVTLAVLESTITADGRTVTMVAERKCLHKYEHYLW